MMDPQLCSIITENLPLPVIVLDFDLKVIAHNNEIFNYVEKNNIIGLYFYEIFDIPRMANIKYTENFKEFLEKIHTKYFLFKTKDGQIIPFYLKLYVNNKLKNIIIYMIDKSLESQLNIEIQNFINEREKTNTFLNRIISIMAHDLRTPFAQIINIYEILPEIKDESTRQELLKLTLESAKNGLYMLDLIIQWSKSVNKNIHILKKTHNLNDLIIKSIDYNKNQALAKGVKIIFTPREETPNVIVDENIFFTVINNLVSNSIKFSYPNSQIEISYYKYDIYYKIAIKDNGIGIDEAIKEKIFNPKEKLTTPGTNNEHGHGLGLLLTKEFVELNGGKIWFESEKNKGTTFYFTVLCDLKKIS